MADKYKALETFDKPRQKIDAAGEAAYKKLQEALAQGQDALDRLPAEIKAMAMGPAEESLGGWEKPAWADLSDPSSEGYDPIVSPPEPKPPEATEVELYKSGGVAYPATWGSNVLGGSEKGMTPTEVKEQYAAADTKRSDLYKEKYEIKDKLKEAAKNFDSKYGIDVGWTSDKIPQFADLIRKGQIQIPNKELENDILAVDSMIKRVGVLSDKASEIFLSQEGNRGLLPAQMDDLLGFIDESNDFKERSDLPPRPADELAAPNPDARKEYESRESYKGFRMPKGMSPEQQDDWKSSIDEGISKSS